MDQEPMQISSPSAPPERPLIGLLIAFLSCYLFCAVILQIRSPLLPSSMGAPVDHFSAGLLWMLSLVSLLMANKWFTQRPKLFFWLAACAALAFLAIDETFEIHEHTERVGVDDDHLKVVAWMGAGVVLLWICRMESARAASRRAMLAGYIFHLMYLLVDVGDGDYFQIPFASLSVLRWAEEIFELLLLSSYLVAFLLIYVDTSRENWSAPPSPDD